MEQEIENFDSQNEDLENIDSENDEVEEVSEEETEESTNDDSEESEEKPEYSDNEKQLYARAKKAEDRLKELEGKTKPKESKPKTEVNDEVTISRLEVRGIMEQEDQNYVLRFAKAEGISPIEALNDDIVKDRIEANKRRRAAASATPRGNNRTANESDEVDMWVRKYNKTGALPDGNPKLTSQILDRLTNGA